MLNKFPNALKVHTYDQDIHLVELCKIGGKTVIEATGEATEFSPFQISYELLLHQSIYIYGFYTSIDFQGYQEHLNWSSNKEVTQVPNLNKISKHCTTFSRRGYYIFPFQT